MERSATKVNVRDLTSAVDVLLAPCSLVTCTIINAAGATAFVQFFDTTGAVSIGTTVPDYELQVASATSFSPVLGPGGLFFKSGIRMASTTTEKGATPSAAGVQVFLGVSG